MLYGKMVFFPENMIFFLWTENERWSFSRNTWYFLYIRIDVTNRIICLSAKKIQRWSSPAKIHLKVIDILGWHSGKSSNNPLHLYGDPYRRFHILLSSEKKTGNVKFLRLKFNFFFNLFGWICSIMKDLQYFVPFSSQELYFDVCLTDIQGNYLSIRRWVIIPEI